MRFVITLMLLTATAVVRAEPTTQPTPQPVVADGPVTPKAEDFESGKRKLTDLSETEIELFLSDLLHRLSYDHDVNNGKGPDGDYLEGWSRKVADEMKDRGYTYTPEKILVRPDGKVAPVQPGMPSAQW